jgi:DNA-binding NarL/FixJ family response regulator
MGNRTLCLVVLVVTTHVSTGHTISVLVADDHPATREGLRMAILRRSGMTLAGEAATGTECIVLHEQLQPDVTLLDLQMPHGDGLSVVAAIHGRKPAAVIVVLTTFEGDGRIARALSLGATSYLLKSSTLDQIMVAIEISAQGRRVLAPHIAMEVRQKLMDQLTSKELVTLRYVANGKTNREIAQTLSLSEEAVKSRMKLILEKLGANDRAHAVRLGFERGFLSI